MIDFRYHLVSIVAVFLALSLGLLLGSTVLSPYVQRGLNGLSKTEKRQIDTYLAEKQQLQAQVSSENQVALANAPAMLHDILAGQRVVLVLVTVPGRPSPASFSWTRPSSTPAPSRGRSSPRSRSTGRSPRA